MALTSFSLADRRVDVDSRHRHHRLIGGKRLRVDRPRAVAVEGVGTDRAQFGEVDMIHAVPDFFVAREAQPNRPARHLRMGDQPRRRRHDRRHSRLVVRTQQSRAVGGDERLSDEFVQVRVFRNADHARRVPRQHDIPSRVTTNHLRLDVGAAGLGGRVHMRVEGDDRRGVRYVRRDGREHHAVRGQFHIDQAHVAAFALEQPAQVELFERAGNGVAPLPRLGVDADIPQETLENVGHGRGPFQFAKVGR